MDTEAPSKSRREAVRRQLLAGMEKGGKAAEIGVWEGNFSQVILDATSPSELHLIDPWLYQPEFGNTGFGRKKNRDRMDEMFHEVKARYATDGRVSVHRAMSAEALETFPDGYFDWVYVDGNHHSPFVGQDLALCRRKVRPGGRIAGDDLHWNSEAGAPVKTAVEALMAELGPKARLTTMANQYAIDLPN
jgi:SAM-dependent methyltransferase